jgi:hypothetical protein
MAWDDWKGLDNGVETQSYALQAALYLLCRDYGKLLESKGEKAVTVQRMETVEEVLKVSDVSDYFLWQVAVAPTAAAIF